MNFKLYSIVFVLINLIVGAAVAGSLVLTKRDFLNAEQTKPYHMIKAELSPSGIEKLKELKGLTTKKVKVKIAGEEKILKLKAPLQKSFEMGPFSADVAGKIVKEVNNR